MPRKPPRSAEQRQARSVLSMTPGTLGGRVAAAAPLTIDVTTLAAHIRGAAVPAAGANHSYTKTGAISATSTGTMRLYNDTGRQLMIAAVRASLATPPSITPVIVDVKMNGTTIYTTTGHRPELTTGSHTVAAALPDVTAWTAGAYLTVDVAQADVAASDLTVQIVAV